MEASPTLMTKTEYARHRGVSQSYISKLARNGILVMRGIKIDAGATDAELDDRPDSGAAPDGQGARFSAAKTLEMVFRAKLRRLEFEAKRSRMVDADGYRTAAADAIRMFRDGLLGIPDRLAITVAAESDPKKVHLAIKLEITGTLTRLADAIAARREMDAGAPPGG